MPTSIRPRASAPTVDENLPAPGSEPADIDNHLAGIGYMLLAIAAFASMDAVGKWLATRYSVFQMLAVRSTVATVMLLALLPSVGGARAITTTQPWAHALRCLFGLGAFLTFFTALRHLPLADTTAVAFGGPFILSALSVPLLGEHVGVRRWAAITVGFIGMLLIVQPTGAGFRPAALLAVAASFFYALMMIMTRRMTRGHRASEPSFAFVFYTLGGQAIAGWLLTGWSWRAVSTSALLWMAAMGLLALGGHFAITLAFRRAPVGVIAPFEYSGLLWAVLLGYFVFGDFPAAAVWLGVALIVAAGLYTVVREARASPPPPV